MLLVVHADLGFYYLDPDPELVSTELYRPSTGFLSLDEVTPAKGEKRGKKGEEEEARRERWRE